MRERAAARAARSNEAFGNCMQPTATGTGPSTADKRAGRPTYTTGAQSRPWITTAPKTTVFAQAPGPAAMIDR